MSRSTKVTNPNAVLKTALFQATALDTDVFQHDRFFDAWFKRLGSAYFFLFKKNLKVTNIQLAELLALLRRFIVPLGGVANPNIQFLSTKEFIAALDGIISSFPMENKEDTDNKYSFISKLYGRLLGRMVVVDAYFGSASVLLPPTLDINLAAVCGCSGYIHSCGRNIFFRNVNKARKSEFLEALKKHLDRFPSETKRPIPFAIYAHEDFTEYDDYMRSDLRHGLDDVKLHVEKLYMGGKRLVSIMAEIRDNFLDILEIPEPGDYRQRHEDFRKGGRVDPTRTIWLVQDKSLSESNPTQPGTGRYYICYDQIYQNMNPFHIFDENKPAWIDHITIPHTLMGAMVNLTVPGWPSEGSVKFCDPFVGSGTTLFETLKYSNVICQSSDLSPVSALLAEDNLEIFTSPAKNLISMLKTLENIEQQKIEPALLLTPKTSNDIQKFIELDVARGVLQLPVVSDNGEISVTLTNEVVQAFRELTLQDRLKLYLAFRTLRRNIGAFVRGTLEWESRYLEETKILRIQFERLFKVREKYESYGATPCVPGGICITEGDYSKICTVNFSDLGKFQKLPLVNTIDARHIPPASYDVIVTDPPYGFNTEEHVTFLAELYSDVIRACVRGLKESGHLVICLPERSYIGRSSPIFTHREVVTQQVIAAADELDLEIFSPGLAVPAPSSLYRPPYYWESEKALARSILHFRFRSRYREKVRNEEKTNQLNLFDL